MYYCPVCMTILDDNATTCYNCGFSFGATQYQTQNNLYINQYAQMVNERRESQEIRKELIAQIERENRENQINQWFKSNMGYDGKEVKEKNFFIKLLFTIFFTIAAIKAFLLVANLIEPLEYILEKVLFGFIILALLIGTIVIWWVILKRYLTECPRCKNWGAMYEVKREEDGKQRISITKKSQIKNTRGEVIGTEEYSVPGIRTFYLCLDRCKECGYERIVTRVEDEEL